MIDVRMVRRRLQRMDWLMAATILILIGIGICFIYSAAFQGADKRVNPLWLRQIVWGILGLSAYFFMALLDYRWMGKHAEEIYATGLILLVLVLFIGERVHGSVRWLKIPGLIRLQPSEFGKIATIVMVARFLGNPGLNIKQPQTLCYALGLMGAPFLLIAMEPDLGTSAVLIPAIGLMLYMAGVPLKYLWLLALAALLALPFGWFALDGYQRERILVFLDPSRDPLGAGWNKMQSQIAVGSGGMMGKGFCQGYQNILGFLPRTVAPTDFIFSVIAEETGFVGSSVVLGLYIMIMMAGIRIALCARDKFGQLLATGLVTMLFVHIFVNVAMTIGLVPITGLPLPLLSYGGSFMLSTMLSLGILQAIYVRRYRE